MGCFLAIVAAGCGDTNQPRSAGQVGQQLLADVGDLCRHFQFMKNKAPRSLADLNTVRHMAGNGFEAIRVGKVVLLYGATLPDTGEEPVEAGADQVLAYEKPVPESGGYVLMLNRVVKKMSAEEFKAAPRPAGAIASDVSPANGKS
jgi:hypothetical protein